MSVIATSDIGGTNCRFGLFNDDGGELKLVKTVWVSTGNIEDTDAFLMACERELEIELNSLDALVAAVAGPVENDCRCALTNARLCLDFAQPRAIHKNTPVRVINDFMAQAFAMLTPCGRDARLLAGPERVPSYAIHAVIGAGTGLGQAMLVSYGDPGNQRWQALPSENGHAVFPFIGDAENEFHKFLCSRLNIPFATGDDTLTGRGLQALHLFLAAEELSPAAIGERALRSDTPTLQWYSRFYGRACRDWILNTLCEGGLWIAGGIAAQNPFAVGNAHFMNEIYNHPRWSDYLRSIPIRLITDKNSGLWGAARVGLALAKQRG